MIAKYFSKKCAACDYVANKTNILDVIKMKFTLKPFNVREEKHLSEVQRWMRWSGGKIPSIEINGNGKLIRKIGVKGLKELAESVGTWVEKTQDRRRPDIGIVDNPVSARGDDSPLYDSDVVPLTNNRQEGGVQEWD